MDGDSLDPRSAFVPDVEVLRHALDLAADPPVSQSIALSELPDQIPVDGIGPEAALELMSTFALPTSTSLADPMAAARMGTPTPWITWIGATWVAARSDNLLHKAITPQVNALSDRVIGWLAPIWGMKGGMIVPGATIANLTALWSGRDAAGATKIITSESAHGSIVKSARVLGMSLVQLESKASEELDLDAFVDYARHDPEGFSRSVVVLTAGTHGSGAIDPIKDAMRSVRNLGLAPAWWHVDASWAGPLALSPRLSGPLAGIGDADTVTISAHKLMFQPTESALVLFADPQRCEPVLEFAGPDNTKQFGMLGSRADRGLLYALTLLAYGQKGLAEWLNASIEAMTKLAELLRQRGDVEVFRTPSTGVLLWRPLKCSTDDVLAELGMTIGGLGLVDGWRWVRMIAANPMLDVDRVMARVNEVLDALSGADPVAATGE